MRAVLALLIGLVTSSGPALADDCRGINKQLVSDGTFKFSYESWVEAPKAPDTLFRFGRCIQLLEGKRRMGVDWKPAGVHGTAGLGHDAIITFPALEGTSKLSPSKLCYGAGSTCVDVEFLDRVVGGRANDGPGPGPGSEKLSQIIKYPNIPQDVLNARSQATLPLEIPGFRGTTGEVYSILAILKVEFISRLPKFGEPYSYQIKASIIKDGPATYELERIQRLEDHFYFSSDAPALATALNRVQEQVGAGPPLAARRDLDDFSISFFARPEQPAPPQMNTAKIEVFWDKTAVGSFLVSFYEPTPVN